MFSDTVRTRSPKHRGHLRDGRHYKEKEARGTNTPHVQLHELGTDDERKPDCTGNLQQPENDGKLYELGV